jgi:chromosome partitioning protein
MKRIALLTLKGGCAKTLSSMAIASILNEKGATAILDLDPEGSARAWASADEMPFSVLSPWEAIPEKLKFLVIDTAPNDRKTLTGVAESVNYIAVPVRVGAQELDRLMPTLDALADVKLQKGSKLGIIITDAGRDGLTAAMPEALAHYKLPLLGTIPHRVGYQRAFGHPIPNDLLEPYRAVVEEMGL